MRLFFTWLGVLFFGLLLTACSLALTEETPPPPNEVVGPVLATVDRNQPTRETQRVWQRTNPGGGGAFATVGAGPTGIIIAASDLSGAYRSLNRGQSWDIIGAADGLANTHVSGLGFDPMNGNVLFLGTDNGLYRSQDGGSTVQQVLNEGYVTDIEIAPGNTQIGYAAVHPAWDSVNGRVYKSLDNGQTWQPASTNLPETVQILELQIDPADANQVYLLAGEGRFACGPAAVYGSRDGGTTWTQLAAELGPIMDLALDTNNGNRLYVTTYGDVWEEAYECVADNPDGGWLYRSEDGGQTWQPLTQRTGLIWLDRDDAQAIRLIDVQNQYPWDERNGVWESPDGVNGWTQVSQVENWDKGWTEAYFAYGSSFNGDAKTLGDDLSDPDALLWANSQWVFGTFDDGRSFTNMFTNEVTAGGWQSRGLDNVVMFDIVVSPANPADVYVGFYDLGCFHSGDGGTSWQGCNHPDYTGDWEGNGGNTFAIAADPTRAGVVWAGQAGDIEETHTLLRSEDAGLTWMEANAGLPGTPLAGLSVDPASPEAQRILYVTAGGDVYRSADDGLNWSLVFDCGGCRVTAVSPNYVYTGGEAGVWRGDLNGSNWVEIGLAEMSGSLGDQFWTLYWEGVTSIAVDPVNPDRIYVVAFGQGKGLYLTQDGGRNWQKLLPDNFMRDTAVSLTNPAKIWAVSSSVLSDGGYDSRSGGIRRSLDGGQSWQTLNAGLDWPFVVTVALDGDTAVYIGSPGAGVYKGTFSPP